jgi:hypothetical protein
MTLADKVSMATGQPGTSPAGAIGATPAIGSLCIPALSEEDGPLGVGDGLTSVTQLPASVPMSSSWDPALARQYGAVLGAEEHGKGMDVDYGPTINIQRDPRWGRNFDALTEDPYLPQDNAIVSDRTMHEIYLPGFYQATTQGGAGAVMCGYSQVNGQYDCQNNYLLSTLDQRWGYSALPLGAGTSSIAVIGADGTTSPMSVGGGSAGVTASSVVSPLQGIQARAGSGVTVTSYSGTDPAQAAATAKAAQVAIVFADNFETEGADLSTISLQDGQDAYIAAVAAANPDTIVVLNTGGPVTMPWLHSVKGVLEAWYPGQQDGSAIAAVLFGDVDPGGHLPETFPASLAQVPASTPAQWTGTGGQVQYSEGLDVGCRWYDAQDQTPLFPFGYGLSYTTFRFSGLHVTPSVVRNTGSGPGTSACGCNGQSS